MRIYNKKLCPQCKSAEITIERRFSLEKRINEYRFICRDCGYIESEW